VFGGNTYGTMLSSEGCAEFLRSISVKYGDGSWECDLPLPVSSPDSPQDASVTAVRHSSKPIRRQRRKMQRRMGKVRKIVDVARSRRNIFYKASRDAMAPSAPPSAADEAQPQSFATLLPISAQILACDRVQFEVVRSRIWDEPNIKGVSSPATVLYLQNRYLRRLNDAWSENTRGNTSCAGRTLLTKKDAISLAVEVMRMEQYSDAEAVPSYQEKETVYALSNEAAKQGGYIGFLSFLRVVGPVYGRYAPSHDEGLKSRLRAISAKNVLPVECPVINSFAPPRPNTRAEILNCGQAVLTAMLNAVKSAKKEIMMSWWEFCLTLPAVRGEELGNEAWIDDNTTTSGCDSAEDVVARSKSLPPILKAKASEGVKTYIILNDVTVGWPLVDYAVKTLSRHDNIYVIRHPDWTVVSDTHHQKFVVVDRAIAILGGVDWTVARWDLPSHPLFDTKSAVHPGLELPLNGKRFKKSISEYWESPQEDLVNNRGEAACYLWQDVAVCVRGGAAADVALNFIHRWENSRVKASTQLAIDPTFKSGRPSLKTMPRIPSELIINDGGEKYSASDVDITAAPTPLEPGGFPSPNSARLCQCQIVRSLAGWSGTSGAKEISHYEAWASAINNAKEFIYIEQQYFVCSMGVSEAKNRIAEAILERVRHAIEKSKPFRVYVVIPATVYMTVVNYFTRRTLLQDGRRGWKRWRERSLMSRIDILLRNAAPGSYWEGKDAESILSVCFLSSVGKSDSGRWDVGEIFVHSKVLVVDDKVAVIGSANVNDRSFVGSSDSELGAILTDDVSTLESDEVGCVKDFRLRLWRQYLGLSLDGLHDDMITDPSSEDVHKLWSSTSSTNQSILSSVFNHFPSNAITCYSDYVRLQKAYKSKSPEERAASLNDPSRLAQVRGFLTKYPPKFLGDDKKRTFAHMILEEIPMHAFL